MLGWGSVDQIFTPQQVTENSMTGKKKVYYILVDLEKAYDKVKSPDLWDVFNEYGDGGWLLNVTGM